MRTKSIAATALTVLLLGSLGATLLSSEANADRWRRSGWSRSTSMIPAGTPINVRLDSKISTDDNQSGDTWNGTVSQDVVYGGRVIIPAGSPVTGVVANSTQGTHNNRPSVDLAVRRIDVNGRSHALNASSQPIVAGSNRAKKLGVIAGSAAVGALLGHTVAKDKHGTLIGGLVGGAAGYGLSRNALRTMQLKPGTVVTFTATEDMVARR